MIAPKVYMYTEQYIRQELLGPAFEAYSDSARSHFAGKGGRMASFRLAGAAETIGSGIIFRWKCEIDRNDKY